MGMEASSDGAQAGDAAGDSEARWTGLRISERVSRGGTTGDHSGLVDEVAAEEAAAEEDFGGGKTAPEEPSTAVDASSARRTGNGTGAVGATNA